jgi:hypothetical protein
LFSFIKDSSDFATEVLSIQKIFSCPYIRLKTILKVVPPVLGMWLNTTVLSIEQQN